MLCHPKDRAIFLEGTQHISLDVKKNASHIAQSMPRQKDPRSENQRAALLAKKARVSKSTARRYLLGLRVMPQNEKAIEKAVRR